MDVTVTFRHLKSSAPIRRYAEEKFARIGKYARTTSEAHVTLSVTKKVHRAEISVVLDGVSLFADTQTEDLYAAIDLAYDKIERQVKKQAAKRKAHKAPKPAKAVVNGEVAAALRLHVIAPEGVSESGDAAIIRTRRIPMKPMSVEEAVMQMDLTNNDFFVFRNAIGEELCVIYRRRDGNFGLIESE